MRGPDGVCLMAWNTAAVPGSILSCERRVHTIKCSRQDLGAALLHLGHWPPLHVARGYMLHAAGHFRRRKQLLDSREPHLPCRWVN